VWVAVSGSAWAAELRLQRDEILRKLNEMAGEKEMFVNIRFGQRPLPASPGTSQTPEFETQNPKYETPENSKFEIRNSELETPLADLTIREIVERRMRIRRERGA
jgi:hypothetical protein